MAVNLINGNDTTITKTNDDIQVEFSSARRQQIEQIENDITFLKPIELYNNVSGTTSNITLLDSITNYKKVIIQFITDGAINSTIIYNNNSNIEKASLMGINGDSTAGWCKYSVVSINETALTIITQGSVNIYENSNTLSFSTSTNNVYITKIIGYKS
jgi:hypothetical protein